MTDAKTHTFTKTPLSLSSTNVGITPSTRIEPHDIDKRAIHVHRYVPKGLVRYIIQLPGSYVKYLRVSVLTMWYIIDADICDMIRPLPQLPAIWSANSSTYL